MAINTGVPFSRGFNFSKWFEFRNVRDIQFDNFTEEDFMNVKSIGGNIIRIPIAMHNFTSGTPDFQIDPVLIKYLDTVVDWAEKHELYVILDNHSFHPVNATDINIDKILIPVWKQIAGHFVNRSDYLLYEILNEPHHICDKRWGEIQETAVKEIRKIDQKHTIIAGGTDFNSIAKLSEIPVYDDKNIIYTFHFYDPHVFTHQGAGWGNPSLASLAGVPFPADKNRMPKTPGDLMGTYVEKALLNYEKDSTEETLLATLDMAVEFSKKRGVPVFCGEFGVFMNQSPKTDRIRWYKVICDALTQRNIPWTSWDYFGGFGIFKTDRKGDFISDVNTELLGSMGFKINL